MTAIDDPFTIGNVLNTFLAESVRGDGESPTLHVSTSIPPKACKTVGVLVVDGPRMVDPASFDPQILDNYLGKVWAGTQPGSDLTSAFSVMLRPIEKKSADDTPLLEPTILAVSVPEPGRWTLLILLKPSVANLSTHAFADPTAQVLADHPQLSEWQLTSLQAFAPLEEADRLLTELYDARTFRPDTLASCLVHAALTGAGLDG